MKSWEMGMGDGLGRSKSNDDERVTELPRRQRSHPSPSGLSPPFQPKTFLSFSVSTENS